MYRLMLLAILFTFLIIATTTATWRWKNRRRSFFVVEQFYLETTLTDTSHRLIEQSHLTKDLFFSPLQFFFFFSVFKVTLLKMQHASVLFVMRCLQHCCQSMAVSCACYNR